MGKIYFNYTHKSNAIVIMVATGGSVIKCFCWSYLKTLLQHIPHSLRFPFESFRQLRRLPPSSAFCVFCIVFLLLHTFSLCAKKELGNGKMWREENVWRSRKRNTWPQNEAKRESKTPPEKKKKTKLKCTRRYWIQFNSIRFVSVVLLQLPRRRITDR